MKNCFTAFVLLCLLAAFTGCENAEPVNPEADRQAASAEQAASADTIFNWCRTYVELSVDSITKGSYLGFRIGETPSSSYTVMQQLRQQGKLTLLSTSSVEITDLSQLEKSLPLYSVLFLRHGEITAPEVSINLEGGKVKAISHYDGVNAGGSASLSQWPASEPASAAVKVGDPAETASRKLVSLKGKQKYASYFQFVLLAYKDLTQGYDPAMETLPEWSFHVPAGKMKEDNILLKFRQGKLSAIVVRHLTYY